MTLLSLPPELIVRVLSLLPVTDLVICRGTCRWLNELIESSVSLQYSIELRVSGAIDNASSPLPITDKLHMLRSRESIWEHLDFGRIVPLPVNFNSSSIYDLTGGIFLLGESLSEPNARTFRRTDDLRLLQISSLHGSKTSDLKHRPWLRIDLGSSIADVGLAVEEHDLIAVITQQALPDTLAGVVEIHLIQISTGEYHPLASQPVIRICEAPRGSSQCSVSVEIVGDMLAILLNFPFPLVGPLTRHLGEFHVLNWKTGREKLVRHMNQTEYYAFVFLSADVITLINCTNNCFELCHIGSALQKDSPDHQPLQTVCSLALPPLAPAAEIRQVLCRSEPNPCGANSDYLPSTKPYRQDPKEAIIIFNFFIRIANDMVRLYSLSLIAHRAALLAWVPPASGTPQREATADPAPVPDEGDAPDSLPRRAELSTIPWQVWGPGVTRWLNGMSPNNRWITTTCGQRHVAVGGHQPAEISIINFNQLALRRFISRHPHAEALLSVTREKGVPVEGRASVLVRAVHDSSTLLLEVFDGAVVSSLPYLMVTTIGEYNYANILLEEDSIIGIHLDDNENVSEVVVHAIAADDIMAEHRDSAAEDTLVEHLEQLST